VDTRQAPQRYVALGIMALLSLSAWCASALASSETQVPRPSLAPHSDESLTDILDRDVRVPSLRTPDSSTIVTLPALADTRPEATELQNSDREASDEAALLITEVPDLATRLPGVSTADLPRFRRYMLRTDI